MRPYAVDVCVWPVCARLADSGDPRQAARYVALGSPKSSASCKFREREFKVKSICNNKLDVFANGTRYNRLIPPAGVNRVFINFMQFKVACDDIGVPLVANIRAGDAAFLR
jgi:hypothetical protein